MISRVHKYLQVFYFLHHLCHILASISLFPCLADRSDMASPVPGSRLRKAPPSPRLPRDQSDQYLDQYDSQKSLPTIPRSTQYLPAITTLDGSLMAPPPMHNIEYFARSASPEWTSRPNTPGGSPHSRPRTPMTPSLAPHPMLAPTLPHTVESEEKKSRHRSWFGRTKDKDELAKVGPAAWIIGHQGRLPYDTKSLISGHPVHTFHRTTCFGLTLV